VLTDFWVKPYPQPFEVGEEAGPPIPINYYDNDDGFWDSHIARKIDRWDRNEMMVYRKFFKH